MGRHIKTQRRSERWKEAEKIQTAYETNTKKNRKICPFFFFFFNGFFFFLSRIYSKMAGTKEDLFQGSAHFVLAPTETRSTPIGSQEIKSLFYSSQPSDLCSLQRFSGITSPSQPPLPSSSRIVCVQKTFFFRGETRWGRLKVMDDMKTGRVNILFGYSASRKPMAVDANVILTNRFTTISSR